MANTHQVVSNDYPYIPIRFEVQGQSEDSLALLDTGYTESLIIPASWRHRLGAPDGRTTLEVGDGRIVHAPVYLGIIEIVGSPPIYGVALTLLADEYILGRRILDRFEITLDHGRRPSRGGIASTYEPVPQPSG
jgi:predicted aspartyl protease